MALERRGERCYYYRSFRRRDGTVGRKYLASGDEALLASAIENHDRTRDRLTREHLRADACQWREMEALLDELIHFLDRLAEAALLLAGYYRHHQGEWRRRGVHSPTGTEEENPSCEQERPSRKDLKTLLQCAQAGDLKALPGLRELLLAPEVWRRAGDLATRVRNAWLDALAKDAVSGRQALEQALDDVSYRLAGLASQGLERLLADRTALCWLLMHQASIALAKNDFRLAAAEREWLRRQQAADSRFLWSVKQLGNFQALLPDMALRSYGDPSTGDRVSLRGPFR